MASRRVDGSTAPYRLVVSGRRDPSANALVEYCVDEGIPVRHLWLDNLIFSWKPMRALVKGASGIYFRGIAPDDSNGHVLHAVRSAITQHPNVVMAPTSTRNWSKPMQAALMRAIVDMPLAVHLVPSHITNSAPIRADTHIIKSISGVRSKVVAISDGAFRYKSGARLPHPVQIQPRLVGENIRVHVIGDDVFACAITTDAIDYRYGSDPRMRPIELPPAVRSWCIEITGLEGLRLSGIDLLRDRDGVYFCFEINPMPGYDYYERRAFPEGKPISLALARALADSTDG